ncbi:MAG: class I SAM-dependent methyltransferase [Burkholderiaceae bacterium]|nr:class I SAM-dependent methyltransferase [Burkholderiaceae bacterium]
MTAGAFSYSGKDNLEAMRLATRYNAFLLALIERHAPRNGRILDFGAGLGLFASMLRDRGHRVSCLEIDPELAHGLEQQGFETVRSPRELVDASVDFLFSLNVLEHIDDDVAAMTALVPKLRRGGRCLIYVPAFQVLFSGLDRLVGHHRRYTAVTLCRSLESAGLRVEHVEYADSLGFPASLAYRIVGGSGVLDPSSVRTYDRWVFPASRALDRVACRWFGKNVFAVARRP